MTLFKSPLLVVDTETTGLPRDEWSGIVEVGAVLLDPTGREIDHFAALMRPRILDYRAMRALEVNQIPMEALEGAPDASDVLDDFRAFYMEHDRPYLTAFNVGFDRPMLERWGAHIDRWARCIMERSTEVMGAAGVLEPGRYGKTWLWPKLSVAAAFFGVDPDGEPHRALTDARTAAGIACAIRRRELAGP